MTRAITLPVGVPVSTEPGKRTYEREAIVNGLSGTEMDLLMATGPGTAKINQIILNCTTSIGDVVDKPALAKLVGRMADQDKSALLFAIRVETYGPLMQYSTKCGMCGKSTSIVADLEKVKVSHPPDLANPEQFTFKTKDMTEPVVLELLSSKAAKVLTFLSSEEAANDPAIDRKRRTFGIWARVVKLNGARFNRTFSVLEDGKPNLSDEDKAELRQIQSLPAMLHTGLHDRILSYERKLFDATVPFTCCGTEQRSSIPVGDGGFFDPPVTSQFEEPSPSAQSDSDGQFMKP